MNEAAFGQFEGRRPRGIGAALAVLMTLAFVGALAWWAETLAQELTWDERHQRPIVEAIVEDGWNKTTLLDYNDTKGPVFFWLTAAIAEITGDSIEALRLASMGLFVLGAVPVWLLVRRGGWSEPRALAAVGLYLLLPYNAVLGQLFMSEPSFMLGAALLWLAFVHAVSGADRPRVGGVLAFGVLLALLLHHRVHAVAYAGAASLVAAERYRWRSWPVWAVCIAAGLSRLPLYFYWGGVVGPAYQARYGIGLGIDNLTYLLIAQLPYTVVLLWPAVRGGGSRVRRAIVAGAVIGLVLALAAPPDLAQRREQEQWVYMGMVATVLRPMAEVPIAISAVFAALSAIGGAALAATVSLGHGAPIDRALGLLQRTAALTFLLGWGLSALTTGDVYDRYLLVFGILMPLIWVDRLPRWLLVIQALGLALLCLVLIERWLN